MLARIIGAISCLGSLTVYAGADSSINTLDQLVQDINAFSFSLQTSATQPEEDAVFSPYSIFTCLSMVYAGAEGETAQEIKKALSLDLDPLSTAQASLLLRKGLVISSKEAGDLHFTSANGLFADRDTSILPFFSKLVKKNYKAKFASLDFGQSDQALQIINGWISNETKGKIPKLMESSDIDATTRLVLVNAVYFQGQWVHPFDPKRTNDQPFHSTEGDVTVSMMQQTSRFSYYETGSAQILALPFTPQAQGPRISCLIVLPQSTADGTDLELSSTLLKDWIDHLTPKKVTLTLPRFCLRTRFDLREALSQMGMADAFTEKADFSGIDGTHDLYLSKVVHEAYFSLNESGVEAAAATGAAMNVTTAGPDRTPPILFTADHPFYFFLIDHESGALLFSGKLFHPDSSACQ